MTRADLFVPAMAACVLLILALDLIAPVRRQPWRGIVAALTALLGVIFVVWRVGGLIRAEALGEATAWLWVASAFDVVGLLDFLVFVLMISRFRDRRPMAERYARALATVEPDRLPDVDVWIATYNEEWEILEKTLVGALHLDWPADKLHIHVLDDGQRGWLAARCEELGVHYITRPDNLHRKAGNHNNALDRTTAPFILSLDADFIVFPHAIRRMIGFFGEPRTAIVQSPQTFHNPEPFRNNLMLQTLLPDDLDLFYRVMQPGRDAWGSAFYCGTSAMLRRAALEEVGGFATQGDIEDQITTMKLAQKGWKTVFLGETLSVGLAPESLSALHDQRNRWCRGSLQILFTRHGPFMPGFTVAQRLFFSQSYWVLGSLMPLWYAILPALVWLFGPRIFFHAPTAEIVGMPALLLAGAWASLWCLGERAWLPLVTPAFQLFMAVELLPTALTSLVKPFGRSLVKILPVTAKGRGCTRRRVDAPSFAVLLAIILATIGALLYASFGPRADMIEMTERLAALGWTVFILVGCSIALLTCFELPYQRREQRFPIRVPATLAALGRTQTGSVENLSVSGALVSVTTPEVILPAGARLTLTVPDLPPLPARVVRAGILGKNYALAFDDLDGPTRRELTARVYLGPERAPPPVVPRGGAVARGLLRRFSRPDL